MWRFWRRRAAPHEAIDEPTWQRTLAGLAFLSSRSAEELARLRALAAEFLAHKAISGAAGIEPDAYMRASIAVQACLPVLNLGLQWYRDFVEVVVYPGAFAAPRRQTDEAGVVHEWTDELAGESMDGGPVVLAWGELTDGSHVPGYNVVIHEFAHKLDLADGQANGCPPMAAALRARWQRAFGAAYDAFVRQLHAIEASIPRHVDPESEAADRFYEPLALDPYAATDPAEFFAVASEAFFVDNARFRAAFASLDEVMRAFYRQQP